jgi:hypothetical protein
MKLRTTNLRKMEDELIETTTTYSDYKDINGFKFGHTFSLSVGKMTLSGTVKSIEVNPKEVLPKDF